MNKGKVVIGMSGGVDSSVSAYLLKKAGYEVIGVTMLTHETDNSSDNSAVSDAKNVANILDIAHYVVDYKKEFKDKVVDYFIGEYFDGKTPNPCVACNKYVKWCSITDMANQINAEFIATGHYAKVEKHPGTGRYTFKISDSKAKDQTYVLYSLTQEQLGRVLMPIGSYKKEEIRKMAEEIGLNVADKPDSMEICFIPDNDYTKYIMKNSDKKTVEGSFVDIQGNVLGKHKGIINYTIGQRKGLGIAFGKPMFVCEIRADSNEVILSDNADLFKNVVYADNVNFMAYESIDGVFRGEAKIRYSHQKSGCVVRQISEMEIECIFDEPQRAITPGQSLVIYEGDYVVCGGTIVLR